ncbi:MAG TPA: hypothetical protein VGG20_21340, partial [Thermoanaerobaculia bacterium]
LAGTGGSAETPGEAFAGTGRSTEMLGEPLAGAGGRFAGAGGSTEMAGEPPAGNLSAVFMHKISTAAKCAPRSKFILSLKECRS